jgi:hypothetical protein
VVQGCLRLAGRSPCVGKVLVETRNATRQFPLLIDELEDERVCKSPLDALIDLTGTEFSSYRSPTSKLHLDVV